MPSAANGRSVKRKSEEATGPPKKRARSEESDDDDPQDHILLLESEIIESKKNYNNIATLLSIANDGANTSKETAVVAAVSLCRVFIRLLASGTLTSQRDRSDKDLVVYHWLRDRLSEYEKLLRTILLHDEWSLTALTLSMRIVKAEGQNSNDKGDCFPMAFFTDIVSAILRQQRSVDGLLKDFIEKYVDEFDDIRFYTFKAVAEIVQKLMDDGTDSTGSTLESFDGAFALLSSIEGVPTSDEELEDFYVGKPKKKSDLRSVSQHKKQAQKAWSVLLNMNLDTEQKKKVLNIMSDIIAPWFTKPELLMDFLTDCYNTGGSISVLALSGVFYLIQERNLDYPSFYKKLYSLLDTDILHSKHRSRFFRLMDIFLTSALLPAQLVASFIKRLSRLCLAAPPAAIVAVVPWVYNILKRHPLCTFMIHRVPRTVEEKATIENEGLADPFIPDEEDPMETHAIDSCLWEIVQLQSHFHPNVATIAKIISEQFTKQFYNVEDFLDHSYGSLFETEITKEVKNEPVVEFQIPKRIFLPQDSESEVHDSLLAKLWDFT